VGTFLFGTVIAIITQDIIERAEAYWQWVSQPIAAQTTGQADLLTRRKSRRSTLG
jgi:hypothetical protein